MSENLPLVSIIVPVYNAERYIIRSLNALLEQSYRQLEILLVDDGSADASLHLLEEMRTKDSRIRVLSKKNGGAASARNLGIQHANGAYYAFVDADDYISPFFVEALLTVALREKTKISVCGFFWTDHPEAVFPSVKPSELSVTVFSKRAYLLKMCEKNKVAATIICNKLFSKEIFEGFHFPEGMSYEDLASTHLLIAQADKIAVIEENLYAYFLTQQSVTRGKYSLFSFRSENHAWDERLRFFRNYNDSEILGKALVSAQRNRVANFCKAYFVLRENREEVLLLRRRFLDDLPETRRISKTSRSDKFLFAVFHYIPHLCAYVVWPIYTISNGNKGTRSIET